MLQHKNMTPSRPARTFILGTGGFTGGAIQRKPEGASVALLGLGRKELDLLDAHAAEKLAALLRADDALVVVSARAPCKTPAMMLENIAMVAPACEALTNQPAA